MKVTLEPRVLLFSPLGSFLFVEVTVHTGVPTVPQQKSGDSWSVDERYCSTFILLLINDAALRQKMSNLQLNSSKGGTSELGTEATADFSLLGRSSPQLRACPCAQCVYVHVCMLMTGFVVPQCVNRHAHQLVRRYVHRPCPSGCHQRAHHHTATHQC